MNKSFNNGHSTQYQFQYEDDDTDIIKAQDIESGKDNTTDAEQSQSDKPLTPRYHRQTVSFYNMKKQFMKEKEHEEEKSVPSRIVVEQSPKGRFQRFNEVLGSGAQKSVYLAYDYDNGREVAWNTINVSLMQDEAISKTKEEIDIMKKLKHPNIISYISGFYNEEKREVIIITELFNGGSLKHHLSKYGIPRLRVIKQWCIEILKGLKYLHELPNPIIHRDLKCDNVFINKNTGRVKIGDLGFSCVLKTTEYAKTFSGTVEFCAPEVFFGKYGSKADVYSFGMTLLEMITNERPYKECDGNIMSICDKATKHIMPIILDRIRNERMKTFIINCLQAEHERPDASTLLNSEFLNDLESEENNYPALGNNNTLEHNRGGNIKKTMTARYHYSPKRIPEISLGNVISPANVTKCENNVFKSPSNPIPQISLVCSNKNEPKDKEDYNSNNTSLQSRHKKEDDILVQLKKDTNNLQSNNDEVTVLLTKRNTESKGYNISFEFNFITDTFEGVAKELQKEIDLTNEATLIIQRKLHDLLSTYQSDETKKYSDSYYKFNHTLQKIITEVEDIEKTMKTLCDFNPQEVHEYQTKMALLEELIQLKK